MNQVHPGLRFVPAIPAQSGINQFETLRKLVNSSERLLVLTGAGASTESGIPDYRSSDVGLYARSNHRPVLYADFLKSASVRQRYWARNFVGWPRFSSVAPNKTHLILAQWEQMGRLSGLITQNVDNLHIEAGSKNIVELHGSAHRVHCLVCSFKESRHDFQKRLIEANKTWSAMLAVENENTSAPDGDVILQQDQVSSFTMPLCPGCGVNGIIKPDIVFFGDNLPSSRKERTISMVRQCDTLLCVGTSLEVFSAYRLVLTARDGGIPIALVNIGPTRGDDLALVKMQGRSSEVLALLDNH